MLAKILAPFVLTGAIMVIPRPEAVEPAGWAVEPEVALCGFGNATIWLIVCAFFIAQGFAVTGLGTRIALLFVRRLGRRSLGLSYGIALTDLVPAPATPSNTARAGDVRARSCAR